jgi:hypothetical protein
MRKARPAVFHEVQIRDVDHDPRSRVGHLLPGLGVFDCRGVIEVAAELHARIPIAGRSAPLLRHAPRARNQTASANIPTWLIRTDPRYRHRADRLQTSL